MGVNSVPSTVSPCSTQCLPSYVYALVALVCAALHGVVCALRL